ncbi:MAG: carbon storage regulator [Gammaproteobacteria bacterium]|nr:carbon storage regulator [Gammaproteobacteria bacterium]
MPGLSLRRKKGERIIINDDITITVLDISSNAVLINVQAPKETQVDREEIYIKKKGLKSE